MQLGCCLNEFSSGDRGPTFNGLESRMMMQCFDTALLCAKCMVVGPLLFSSSIFLLNSFVLTVMFISVFDIIIVFLDFSYF